MSQTIRLTEINGAFYPEILTAFPDRDEVIGMIQDMTEDGVISESEDCYEAVTEWYEIGNGESGTDTFFTDEALIDLWNKGGIKEIENVTRAAGYDFEHIQCDTISVLADEID